MKSILEDYGAGGLRGRFADPVIIHVIPYLEFSPVAIIERLSGLVDGAR
jgi:hypothetical protein